MHFLPVPDLTSRQIIDAITVFDEHRRVAAEAVRYAGGMYWKRQGNYEYLVKTRPDNSQQRIGPRSEDTQQTYSAFMSRKAEVEARRAALTQALREAERLNKAVRAGRTPAIVVDLLNGIERAGLGAHFTVVGTHALYAYETAAGVRISPGALATQDVDLLWDARRRVQFLADIQRLDTSMLRLLQTVDASFRRKDLHNETAINDRGFEVDFLRRMPMDGDPHPFRFSDDEEDLWPVQAVRASVLTEAPRFEHVVIAAAGRMALMRTVVPSTFVAFKRWMAQAADNRPAPKRRRDQLQADIVQAMIEGHLLPE